MDGHAVRRVLVVDDEPGIREVLTLNLRVEGFEVTAADNGRAAVDAVRRDLPDLVIMDIMMPTCDGLTALREVKADPRTADVPVVLLTAKATDAEIWEGWEAGADYYITKPFDIDEILNFINYLRVEHV